MNLPLLTAEITAKSQYKNLNVGTSARIDEVKGVNYNLPLSSGDANGEITTHYHGSLSGNIDLSSLPMEMYTQAINVSFSDDATQNIKGLKLTNLSNTNNLSIGLPFPRFQPITIFPSGSILISSWTGYYPNSGEVAVSGISQLRASIVGVGNSTFVECGFDSSWDFGFC